MGKAIFMFFRVLLQIPVQTSVVISPKLEYVSYYFETRETYVT